MNNIRLQPHFKEISLESELLVIVDVNSEDLSQTKKMRKAGLQEGLSGYDMYSSQYKLKRLVRRTFLNSFHGL